MRPLERDLSETLTAWNGKQTDTLKECLDRHRDDPALASALIQHIGSTDPLRTTAASWLLKARLEDGPGLADAETADLVRALPAITGKDAALHICQIVRHLVLEPAEADAVHAWIGPLLIDERPFLRAWSMDALVALAAQFPRFAPEAKQSVEQAEHDPAPSVRARARHLSRV